MARSKKRERASEIQRLLGAEIERRARLQSIAPVVLANAAEIDLSQMLKIFAGKCGVSPSSLERIAVALGCTPGALMDRALRVTTEGTKAGRAA